MSTEKRKRMPQVFDLYGENLSGPDGPLETWEKKFVENTRRRREELRAWLLAHGCEVRKEKNEEVKHE